MSEWTLVWIVVIKLVVLSLFVMLYVTAGRKWKWMRRAVGGTLLIGGVCAIASILHKLTPQIFLASLFYIEALSMGYGGDTFQKKLVRRFWFGANIGAVGFFISAFGGSLEAGFFQFMLAIATSLYFGLLNPTAAVNEEAIIATSSVAITLLAL